jgi:hypothetical protein
MAITDTQIKTAIADYKTAADALQIGLTGANPMAALKTYGQAIASVLDPTGVSDAGGMIRRSESYQRLKQTVKQLGTTRSLADRDEILGTINSRLLPAVRQSTLEGRMVEFTAPGTPDTDESIDDFRIQAGYELDW